MRRSCRLSPVELRLTVDKDIGQEPVGFAPGVQNLIGCRLAQYVADRRQQRVGDRRIMFGLDMGLDMARGDLLTPHPAPSCAVARTCGADWR